MMTDDQIRIYLAAALDQEACKATLTATLHSRVAALRQRQIADAAIVTALEILCADPFQLNDDVIEDIIEAVARGPLAP